VTAPRDLSQRVGFLATVENFRFTPAQMSARVVINSRTGTIVVGENVRLLPAAITHGGLTVTISENVQANQPNALAQGETVITTQSIIDIDQSDSRMFKFEPGVTLEELVRAVNQVGAAPGDLMAILEALRQAGALQGEIVVI
jgi:flagellar P-ring protein precursor FlgI